MKRALWLTIALLLAGACGSDGASTGDAATVGAGGAVGASDGVAGNSGNDGTGGSGTADGSTTGDGGDPNFPVDEAFAAQLEGQGVPVDIARFLAAARVEASSPDPRTYLFKQTFPNQATREMTMVLTPNQTYTPTADELAQTAASGSHVYDFKYTSTPGTDGVPRIELDYFVPDDQLPPELRDRLASGQGAIHEPLLLADGAMSGTSISWVDTGKKGLDVDIFSVIDYAKSKGISTGPLGSIYALASVLSDITSALALSKQTTAWLTELDALEKCAANPTNMVAQSDPNYTTSTVAKLDAARGELKEASAVRFLNIMTETATGLTPITAVLSIGMKSGFMWSEQTLNNYSENTLMREARLEVVKCDPPMPGTGNVDVQYTCTTVAGSETDMTTWHVVSKVNWAGNPMTQQYTAMGSYVYESTETHSGGGSGCTITGQAMGSLDGSGMLISINNPLVQQTLGYGYTAVGNIDAMIGINNGCQGNSYVQMGTVQWLPAIKGLPGTGGAIAGMMTTPVCQGNGSSGTQTINWSFMLPPTK